MRTPTRSVSKDGRVSWKVRYRLNDRQTSWTFHDPHGKKDAETFCRDLEDMGAVRAHRRLMDSLARRDAPTLDVVFADFVKWKEPRVRSERTVVDYERDYHIWIRPHLGSRSVIDIRPEDVQAWVDGMVAGKVVGANGRRAATKSIVDRHALLHQVLKYAAGPSRRDIDSNPAAETELPKRRKQQPKALNPAEWRALSAALQQIDPDAHDLADFLLASGWRWSEGVALTTYDVEDYGPNPGVDVEMWVSMSHVARRGADNRVAIVQDAKSADSQRRTSLDRDIAAVIRRRLYTAPLGGLVFTTKTGAAWHYSNFRDRAWDPAVKAANLAKKPTPHWLRHSQVFWGDMAGATMPQLSRRIGHASSSFTVDTYGGGISDIPPQVLDRLAVLRRGRDGPVAVEPR